MLRPCAPDGRVVSCSPPPSFAAQVVGYDPVLSLDAAWKLPGDRMTRADSLDDLLRQCDYLTIHVPYIKGATHHMLNGTNLKICKPVRAGVVQRRAVGGKGAVGAAEWGGGTHGQLGRGRVRLGREGVRTGRERLRVGPPARSLRRACTF